MKRMLRWPKQFSNTAALLAVDIPTKKSRVLTAKLRFLHRVTKSDCQSLSGRAILALSEDVDSICLVRECRDIEESFGTHFTNDILEGRDLSFKHLKETIYTQDRDQQLQRCSVKATVIAELAIRGGWSRAWDAALDLGEKSIRGLQYLSRVMSHHGRGNHPCPLCNAIYFTQDLSASTLVG